MLDRPTPFDSTLTFRHPDLYLQSGVPGFDYPYRRLKTTYNFPVIQAQDVDQLRGLDARSMIKRAQLPAWKIPLIASSFIRRMAQDIDQILLFDGIPHLLSRLASHGVKLAIVSSNGEENIRRVLGPESASLIIFIYLVINFIIAFQFILLILR